MQNRGDGRHIVGVTALFVATTLIAVTMLLFALLLFLAELIGSMVGALLIIGLLSAIVALTLYFGVVRPEVATIRDEISTLYEMAHFARCGYDWVMQRVESFIKCL